MMNNDSFGKVFIAWNGEKTGKIIALIVKEKLKEKGYLGVVGGETLKGTVSIGEKIFGEIDECVNAIIILTGKYNQEKDEQGSISFNTTMEWGYCHSHFKNKEEVFLINLGRLNEFDIQGFNANPIEEQVDFADEEKINEIAETIVNIFIEKQVLDSEEKENDYLVILDNYSLVEQRMENVNLISHYDLACHILLYSQAAYIFHRIADCTEKIKEFAQKNSKLVSENAFLKIVISYSYACFEMFNSVEAIKGKKTIPDDKFSKVSIAFADLISKADAIPEQYPLRNWVYVSIYKNLNYMFYVKALETKNDAYFNESIEFGKKCIDICDKLIDENPVFKHYALLCKSYMYRNFLIIAATKGDRERAKKYSQLALDCKRDVYYDAMNYLRLHSSFVEYIETEYYLSLAENIKYAEEFRVPGYLADLDAFVQRIEYKNRRRLSSLEYIRDVIHRENLKLFIIDFDLTLANTVDASKVAYYECFKMAGWENYFEPNKILDYLNEHLQETYLKTQNQANNALIDYETFKALYIETFNKNLDKVSLYEDAVDFLNVLSTKNKKVIIYSNRDEETIRKVLEKEERLNSIPQIICADKTKNKRKSSDDIEEYMAENNANPDNTVYIGDSYDDKSCALGADVDFYRLNRYNTFKNAKPRHPVIKDFTTFFK